MTITLIEFWCDFHLQPFVRPPIIFPVVPYYSVHPDRPVRLVVSGGQSVVTVIKPPWTLPVQGTVFRVPIVVFIIRGEPAVVVVG